MKVRSACFLLLLFTGLVGLVATGVTGWPPPAPAEGRLPVDLAPYPWLYLRDGRPLQPDESVVELIAVGDVMLGRGVADVPDPFAGVAGWLRASDLLLGNLESVIVAEGTPRAAPPDGPQPYLLKAPPTAVSQLETAGFDILGLANNHALDYGPAGLAETVERLKAAGLEVIGVEPNLILALEEVKGVRLAFLALNAVPDPVRNSYSDDIQSLAATQPKPASWDGEAVAAAIRAARRQADAVILTVHWGYEYQLWPDPAQERMARQMVEAGADLVIGHHPHVVQPTGSLTTGEREALVAYSLGNFVFDQGQGETGQGLALRAFFDHQGLRAVQALPLRGGPRPRLLSIAEAAVLLARLQPAPQRVAFTCDAERCQSVEESELEAASAAGGGLFHSGVIDLTGDGVDERVTRRGTRLTIYEGDERVWQSPAEWQVLDAALGDPNDDGRSEILLAILRPDPGGHLRSQPYLIGHRGGRYQLLWGGRPVVHPIQEVALGDVNGDGVEELVVIGEADGGRMQALAVWRWYGWSFSLLGRSSPGHYSDLTIIPASSGHPAILSVAIQTP